MLPGEDARARPFYTTLTFKFIFCAIFTAPLLLHMLVSWHWLHNPWIQFALTLPVYLVGMAHFGTSAFRSLRNGVANMDVLVTLGATAAFAYSLIGAIQEWGGLPLLRNHGGHPDARFPR